MQKVFITGANGLIGSNLCHKLTELGYDVIAMVRAQSNLLGLTGFAGKIISGDILEEKNLTLLMGGSDFVFHTAGLVSFDNRRRDELFRVNVEGTRNVMNVALQVGVKKVVHTSSVATIGIPAIRNIADETVEYNRLKYNIAYSDSKHFGEIQVEKAVERGLDVVIINPASVVGQRDVYSHFESPANLERKEDRTLRPGGMCVVGVEDVVAGEIAALMPSPPIPPRKGSLPGSSGWKS